MTIRRRLFISNLLMLLIPILASILFSYAILFAFSAHSFVPMERAFPKAFGIILGFQREKDVDSLRESVKSFNSEFSDESIFMAVMQGDRVIYPERAPDSLSASGLIAMLLRDDFSGNLTLNNTRIMVERVGEYRILVADLHFNVGERGKENDRQPMTSQALLILCGVVLTAIATNRLLTRLVTRSVTGPLDMLVDGVHQLRDGNLEYRIRYDRHDEFTPVCNDFNEMAEHLQRLIERQQKDDSSRKELLAGISHDLRTPLTSIKAYVEGLLDGVAEDYPTQLKYLGIIRQKSEEIDRLVDKLFLFSKLDIDEFPFHCERLELGAAIFSLTESVGEEYLGRGLQILFERPEREIWIFADPVQLQNAVINIMENSVKYKKKELGTMMIACRSEDSHAALLLTDDGPGVPPESLDTIFDVFYRVDPSRRNPSHGSGLGLAIAKRIMERMGGGIRAENAEGGGLRMILRVPQKEEDV